MAVEACKCSQLNPHTHPNNNSLIFGTLSEWTKLRFFDKCIHAQPLMNPTKINFLPYH